MKESMARMPKRRMSLNNRRPGLLSYARYRDGILHKEGFTWCDFALLGHGFMRRHVFGIFISYRDFFGLDLAMCRRVWKAAHCASISRRLMKLLNKLGGRCSSWS